MRNTQYPGRSPVMSTEAMVATSQPMATEAAIQVLRDGGNALDAAIAASAVLGVVESYSSGIGGDCFILYHQASTGKLHAINGSGRSPAAATPQVIRDRGHDSMPEQGILSVTVPGAIDAWYSANEKLGKLPMKDLLAPAIHYASKGYVVSPIIADNWKQHEALLAQTEESARAYLVNGQTPAVGTIHRQPDLADTMTIIAEKGRDSFYQGEIAEQIIRFSDSYNGLLSLDDLARHETQWVTPISSDYRGYRVYEIPPNGQGITTLMALNILKQTELSNIPHLSADHIHLLSEAFTLSMAERDRFVADPNFEDMPVDQLLSSEFARSQFNRINMSQAMTQPVKSAMPKHKDTVYLSVVDKDRNACSFINSVFYSWGSGLVAGNSGINLQNRGSGFSLEDDHFNQLEPGKRPMHTIIPAMLYKDDQPVLSFGVMGGQYQAMGQTYVISNCIDYGMDVQQALDAARFFLYDGQLSLEAPISWDIQQQLANRGHRVVSGEESHGGGQLIYIDWQNGVLHGGSDPRKDGMAAGY
ncbi:MAG: gamma-glutamyltransferase [Gammaproteobacteria bacterium]|nr:gamma-glutamyltransferase [Gammaproteobacteria bacterium]